MKTLIVLAAMSLTSADPRTPRRSKKSVLLSAILALLGLATLDLHATDVIISGRDPGSVEKVGTINGASALLTLSNATVTSTSSTPLPVTPNVDMGVWLSAVAGNAGTSNLVVGFNFTPDNVLYSTTLPLTLTTPLTGTNTTVQFFIVSRTNFYGVKSIRWDSSQTTQTNLVTINGLTYRFLTP